MKMKILTLVCVFLFLSGCKVELPSQVNSTPVSQPDSSSVSSEPVSSVGSNVPSSSEASSPASSAAAALSSTTSSAASSKTANSGTVSSRQTVKAASSAAPTLKEQSCTFSISAADILQHKDRFNEDQLIIVPKDGILYAQNKVTIQDGETVYQVLLRVTKASGITMTHASAFQSEYVQSIGGIEEKTYGPSSGWTYLVNGKQPPVACSNYKLKSGDKVQWLFVCGNAS